MADLVRAAGVVQVREIRAGLFKALLDFRKVGGGADFAEADDVRGVAVEEGDGSGFLLFRFGRGGEGLVLDPAVHGEPVFDVVGDEAETGGGGAGGRGGGVGSRGDRAGGGFRRRLRGVG